VALKNLLKMGNNELLIDLRNEKPNQWGVEYKVGVFDENNQPAYDAIHVPIKGYGGQVGTVAKVVYEFPMS
jgi:hypothetical protein